MLTLNDGRKELYQYDTGRTATVTVECDIVHFSGLAHGTALAVKVKDGVVEIPNDLLMLGTDIYAWAFVVDDNGGYTKKEQVLKVNKRPKPSDYVYTESEIITIETAVNDALEKAKESGEFDGEKGEKGDKGKTPEKGVDYFTEADKNEIVADVLNSLPEWQGGSY